MLAGLLDTSQYIQLLREWPVTTRRFAGTPDRKGRLINTIENKLPRVTVAAVIPDGQRFLLVEEQINGRAVLNQPAGHLDPNESLIDAVIRETLEESGWTVRPLGLIGIYQLLLPQVHFVRLSFLCEPISHDPGRVLDHGIIRTHWLGRDEIANHHLPLRSTLVLRCVDDHLSGRLWPLDTIVEPYRCV